MERPNRRIRRRQIELLLREAPTLPEWTALPEASRQETLRLLALMLTQHARAVRGAAEEVRDE
jgi:hypothetical protein